MSVDTVGLEDRARPCKGPAGPYCCQPTRRVCFAPIIYATDVPLTSFMLLSPHGLVITTPPVPVTFGVGS